ncbi:hypothetical protein G7046_g2231 [Stylonectria norvegica]|nr:hypothetical protein G7046_g2231 [Stylonectria norvegica]
MQASLPGPCETIVSSIHGNAASSDASSPVSISRYSHGAVVAPSTPSPQPHAEQLLTYNSKVVGKVHFALPLLRSIEEETFRGKLTSQAIVSTTLQVSVTPYGGEGNQTESEQSVRGDPKSLPLHRQSKITCVELYAGRELLGSWENEKGDARHALPADRDFSILIESEIYGRNDCRLNESQGGLGVTLTIEFGGELPGLNLDLIFAMLVSWAGAWNALWVYRIAWLGKENHATPAGPRKLDDLLQELEDQAGEPKGASAKKWTPVTSAIRAQKYPSNCGTSARHTTKTGRSASDHRDERS